jgi:Na+/H+ antiporter NhaD/arsenite permease-like protein
MCGDPPNIIIGTSLGYSFADFIQNTGIIAGISLIVIILYFYLVFRKDLSKSNGVKPDPSTFPEPSTIITNKKDFYISCAIFLCAIVLLVSHAQTGLTVATIGVFISAITLITAGKDALSLLKKVDYKTLLFFVGLFIVVGGLEQTGVLELLAGVIETVSGGQVTIMVAIIIILSAVASAFVDNIPFAATMIPVIKSLAAMNGLDTTILAWTLAMGTDIGGSATPIGASANVVGIAVASKEGYLIGWGKYCRTMVPATIIVIAISLLMINLRYL